MTNIEKEAEITILMLQLQQVSKKIDEIIAPYAAIIEKASKELDDAAEQYSKKSVEIQEKIKTLTFQLAKSIKTGSGNITYKKGGVRRKWDLDKLDLVCTEDGNIKEKIWKYRTEDSFLPQVLIKINTEGKSVMEL